MSAGPGPEARRHRYVHRTVEGTERVTQKASDDLASEVKHCKHPGGRGTVAELLEEWMLLLETQNRAPSAMIRFRSAIDVRIVPALGPTDVTKLTAADLDASCGVLLREGLHPLSVQKCHAVL
ncbi:MAG: hypothetical protein ACYCVN_11115 [Acidimicrobiales bacterium]